MKRIGILIGLGVAASVLVSTTINAYLPSHLGEQGFSASLIGVILTLDNYLSVFTIGLLGWLSDRWWTPLGRRRPWVLGAAPVVGLMLILIPTTLHVGLLMAIIALLNFAVATVRVNSQALLADRVPPASHGLVNGIIQAVIALVVIIGYLLSGAAAGTSAGLSGALGVVAVLVLLVASSTLLVREERTVATTTTSELRQAAPIWTLLRQDAAARRVVLGLFFALMTLGTADSWMPDIAQRGIGVAPEQMSSVLAASTILLVVVSVPAGIVARRAGTGRVLRLCVLALGCAYAVGAAAVRDLTSLGVLAAVVGVFSAALYTLALPLLYEHVPLDTSNIGIVTGFFFVLSNLAAAVGPQLGGILIDVTGSHFSVLALCAISALASAGIWLTVKSPRAVAAPAAQVATSRS